MINLNLMKDLKQLKFYIHYLTYKEKNGVKSLTSFFKYVNISLN